jgi:hypothetical protein
MASSRNSIVPKLPNPSTQSNSQKIPSTMALKDTAEYDIEGYFDFDYDTNLPSAIVLDNAIRFPAKGFTFATWIK